MSHLPQVGSASLPRRQRVNPRLAVSLASASACALCLVCLVRLSSREGRPRIAPLARILVPHGDEKSSSLASAAGSHLSGMRKVDGVRAVVDAGDLAARGVTQQEFVDAVSEARLAIAGKKTRAVVRQLAADQPPAEDYGQAWRGAAPGSAQVAESGAAQAQGLPVVPQGAILPANAGQPHDHPHSRLFEHFDADSDGLLSEREVAMLLKQLTRKKKDEDAAAAAAATAAGANRAAGRHDITIDGETLSVGDGDFDLLFKQLSNLKQTKDPSKDPRMTLQEDIVFIKDLVIVFFAATIGGVVATHFGQPALIGFLLGGMTVGPGGLGAVTELVEVETLASLGIAFLLFCLGIEFSLSELQGVRRVVVFGGFVSMLTIVLGTGLLSLTLNLVKTIPEAIALGLAVSLSSTAIVLQCLPPENATRHSPERSPVAHSSSWNDGRPSNGATMRAAAASSHQRQPQSNPAIATGHSVGAHISCGPNSSGASAAVASAPDRSGGAARDGLTAIDLDGEDRKESTSTEVSSAFATSFDSPRSRKVMLGLLVFQDVTIGLILALLPTLQGTFGQFVEELLSALLRLGCFTVISLFLAEFVLPTLADRVDKAQSQEVFTMGCVVFCLAMSYLSERMGLAIELGAFAAGIMLSESRHKLRIEEAVEGIRIVFSAVFFISVGMMIHWRYFYQNFLKMLILLFVILFTKALAFGVVVFALGGLPLSTALACGAAIAQAGEFTFVVASKGQALLLFSASEARMINGATALSMLASPYIITFARRWSQRRSLRSNGSCGIGQSEE